MSPLPLFVYSFCGGTLKKDTSGFQRERYLIFGEEIKLSPFADHTTPFNANIESLEMALKIVGDFGRIAGLSLKQCKENEGAFVGEMEK